MLTKKEALEDTLVELDIHIYAKELSSSKKAVAIKYGLFKAIALDKKRIETPSEEFVLLAG